MSEDALSRAERINTLIQNWREMVAGQKPKILFDTIGLLAENPFWTTKKIAERLNVAFTTAQRAINLLKEKQIVTQIDQAQRDRVFCSKAIMNILDEAPKINAVDGK